MIPKIETDMRALFIKMMTRPTTPEPQPTSPEYVPTHIAEENLGSEIPKNSASRDVQVPPPLAKLINATAPSDAALPGVIAKDFYYPGSGGVFVRVKEEKE